MTVEARRAPKELSSLEYAVLEAIAYADVFDYPVTREEILRALPLRASAAELEAVLSPDGPFEGVVSRVGDSYTLAGREALVEVRRRREAASADLMRQARAFGSLIARLPFVRMVAVTGSLAVDNADTEDDLDYLIVTAPGRVWLARALVTALVVRMAKLRGLTVCPNYVLSESALALPERDAYTARELLQMRPVAGHDVYGRMLAANAWCRDLLPNWRVVAEVEEEQRSLLARLGERLLGGRLGDVIERWLLRRKGGELRREAGDNSEAVFDETVCKGHFDAHRARLQTELASRLRSLEVRP
jgi:hypothetical protein